MAIKDISKSLTASTIAEYAKVSGIQNQGSSLVRYTLSTTFGATKKGVYLHPDEKDAFTQQTIFVEAPHEDATIMIMQDS